MVLYPSIELLIKLDKLSESQEENRNRLRKLVIDHFSKERAGEGSGEATSKYKYIVENLCTGHRVYLTRPVPLNKGFDFVIHVEDHVFTNGKDNPSHDDIFNDLVNKKNFNLSAYNHLIQALESVFYCKDPADIYPIYEKELTLINQGLQPELILKVVKWFFIEQDIRYWNWSGRNMFMNGIRGI